jgi:hypothetical protein
MRPTTPPSSGGASERLIGPETRRCHPRKPVLGDLVAFAAAGPNPDYGVIIGVNEAQDTFTVMWPWDIIDCSITVFEGERWGNLKVVTDES